MNERVTKIIIIKEKEEKHIFVCKGNKAKHNTYITKAKKRIIEKETNDTK